MNVSDFRGSGKGGEILDFSAALNPLGMPPTAKNAINQDRLRWMTYPDPNFRLLRKRLSVHENVPMENIVCCGGGDSMIFRTICAVKPKKALVFLPCPGEYSRALEQFGCNTLNIQLSEKKNFTVTSEIAEFIDSETDMIFLCNPNNPTGEVITPYTLRIIAEKCRRTDTVMVCDERYIDFAYIEKRYSAKNYFGNKIVIIKSFTKTFSMAGLPVGYALCGDENLAAKIRNASRAHGVSGAALAAAEAAVKDEKFLKMSRKYVTVERRHLSEELTRLGLPVFPSRTCFLLFKCELPLDTLLLKKGIKIKNCSESYGLPNGYFRISVRMKEDNDILIETIEKILQTY